MKKWYDEEGYGICSKTMMMLYPLMEAVRSGRDIGENICDRYSRVRMSDRIRT